MRLANILFFGLSLFFSGCKKTDVQSGSSTDECFTTQANGVIIEGQYIIAYNNFEDFNSPSTLRIAEVSKDVLKENGISSQRCELLLRVMCGVLWLNSLPKKLPA